MQPPLRLHLLSTVTDGFLTVLLPIQPVSCHLLKGCLRSLLCAAFHPANETNVKLSHFSGAVMSKCLYLIFLSELLKVCLLLWKWGGLDWDCLRLIGWKLFQSSLNLPGGFLANPILRRWGRKTAEGVALGYKCNFFQRGSPCYFDVHWSMIRPNPPSVQNQHCPSSCQSVSRNTTERRGKVNVSKWDQKSAPTSCLCGSDNEALPPPSAAPLCQHSINRDLQCSSVTGTVKHLASG